MVEIVTHLSVLQYCILIWLCIRQKRSIAACTWYNFWKHFIDVLLDCYSFHISFILFSYYQNTHLIKRISNGVECKLMLVIYTDIPTPPSWETAPYSRRAETVADSAQQLVFVDDSERATTCRCLQWMSVNKILQFHYYK